MTHIFWTTNLIWKVLVVSFQNLHNKDMFEDHSEW